MRFFFLSFPVNYTTPQPCASGMKSCDCNCISWLQPETANQVLQIRNPSPSRTLKPTLMSSHMFAPNSEPKR